MQQIGNYVAENGLLIISRVICLGFLTGLSVMDIKYRVIPGYMLMAGSMLAAGYCALFCLDHIWLNLGGLLVGLFFVLVSKMTGEGLGYGDSWLLCALGLYLGIWKLLELLMAAWTGAAVAAMAVLAMRRCRRGTVLPMVPFIAAGYVVMWVSEILLCMEKGMI